MSFAQPPKDTVASELYRLARILWAGSKFRHAHAMFSFGHHMFEWEQQRGDCHGTKHHMARLFGLACETAHVNVWEDTIRTRENTGQDQVGSQSS